MTIDKGSGLEWEEKKRLIDKYITWWSNFYFLLFMLLLPI